MVYKTREPVTRNILASRDFYDRVAT